MDTEEVGCTRTGVPLVNEEKRVLVKLQSGVSYMSELENNLIKICRPHGNKIQSLYSSNL